MNFDSWNKRLTLIANIGVVLGLIFVAIEVRTNTASNNIAIEQNYAGNWMTINTAIGGSSEVARLFERGLAGEELEAWELRQFRHLTNMFLTQTSHMLRLYDSGFVPETELRNAFRLTREYAGRGQFRKIVEEIQDPRFRGLILDEDGLDRWLSEAPQ